jgi:hypothetical protein
MEATKPSRLVPVIIGLCALGLGFVGFRALMPKQPAVVAMPVTQAAPTVSTDALTLIYKQQALRSLYKSVPLRADFAPNTLATLTAEVKAKRLTCNHDLTLLTLQEMAEMPVITCINGDGLKLEARFPQGGKGEVLFTAPSGDTQLLTSG